MRKIIIAFLFINLLFAGSPVVHAQTIPRFEAYAVPVYKGKVAPVNLKSAKGASSFRTRLREGAKEGVNFAGHYTLVNWGCGASCATAGIIDAKTGKVYFPQELVGFSIWFWPGTDEPFQIKPNSRLLLLAGFPGPESESENPKGGLYYYEWTGTRLRLVKFVPKKREEGR